MHIEEDIADYYENKKMTFLIFSIDSYVFQNILQLL
jgi:hypothetical protein